MESSHSILRLSFNRCISGNRRNPSQLTGADIRTSTPRTQSLPKIPPIKTNSKVKYDNAGDPKCPGRCANSARSVHEVSSRRKAERRAAAARIHRDEHFRVTPSPAEPTQAPSHRESPGHEKSLPLNVISLFFFSLKINKIKIQRSAELHPHRKRKKSVASNKITCTIIKSNKNGLREKRTLLCRCFALVGSSVTSVVVAVVVVVVRNDMESPEMVSSPTQLSFSPCSARFKRCPF